MQKAQVFSYCVHAADTWVFLLCAGPAGKQAHPQCVGTERNPVSLHCGMTWERGQRAMVGPALAPYRGSAKAGTHGHWEPVGPVMAFVSSFQYREGPTHEQACCSHLRKARALALPYWVQVMKPWVVPHVSDWEVELSGTMGVKEESWGCSRNNPWDDGTGKEKVG